MLEVFSNRLAADNKAHCFFVSQDNAKDFRILTEKARTTNTYYQCAEKLSAKQSESLNQLQKEWQKSDEIMFDWLNLSYKVDELAAVNVDHRRLLVDVTADAISWTENRHRAEALLNKF